MIEHYQKFRHISEKSKSRFELISYTEPVYEPLFLPYIYFMNTPERIRANQKRKSDFGISQREWISSVFIPDITKPYIAYGDIKGSDDLLLIFINGDELEFYICRGKKSLFQSVLNLYFDGELDEEIQGIRERARNSENSIITPKSNTMKLKRKS